MIRDEHAADDARLAEHDAANEHDPVMMEIDAGTRCPCGLSTLNPCLGCQIFGSLGANLRQRKVRWPV